MGLGEDKGQHQKVLWGTFPPADCSLQPGHPGTEPRAGTLLHKVSKAQGGGSNRNAQSGGLRAKRVSILVLPVALFLPRWITRLCGLGLSSVTMMTVVFASSVGELGGLINIWVVT